MVVVLLQGEVASDPCVKPVWPSGPSWPGLVSGVLVAAEKNVAVRAAAKTESSKRRSSSSCSSCC